MGAVYRKELRTSMRGVAAPLFMALIFAIVSVFCFLNSFNSTGSGSAHFEYTLISASFWSLLFVPLVTMRMFSEERHSKTDQLLQYTAFCHDSGQLFRRLHSSLLL